MNIVSFVIGIVVGIAVTVGAILIYIKWMKE